MEGSRPSCTAPAMASSAASCAQCGKEGVGFKRCSVCKDAWYCGAACQNANWKRHKKDCSPPVPLEDVVENVNVARAARDWHGILKWEGRMEELFQHNSDAVCEQILGAFSHAHQMGFGATGSKDHMRSMVGLEARRIVFLGKLQRFRDQGEAMCDNANMLVGLNKTSEASLCFERARDVGAAHGFFSVESKACKGLGMVAFAEGRHEEGLALLRNALVAAELNELDDPTYEISVLHDLVGGLFHTHAIDEVEPMVQRYREATKAQSDKKGSLAVGELLSLIYSARLHEVMCLCPPHCAPLHTTQFQHGRIASLCRRLHRARERKHAPVEPSFLSRHVGGLRRLRGRCVLCST